MSLKCMAITLMFLSALGGSAMAQAPDEDTDKCLLSSSLVVTVLDRCNVPVPGATITIDGFVGMSLTTNSSGIAVVAAINSGGYTVRVAKAPYVSQFKYVTVGCGTTSSTTFQNMTYQLPNPKHKADTTHDGKITYSELSRVIQFYNAGQYYCLSGTEDGYAPGAGSHSCTPHSSDYSPQNWSISLSELNRIIQFYNQGGYYRWLGTEDGYAAVTCPR